MSSESAFIVYALSSIYRNYIYVGLTDNIKRRILQHNNGWSRSTSPYKPFRIILIEGYPIRVAARKREKYLKSGVGKKFLKTIKELQIDESCLRRINPH